MSLARAVVYILYFGVFWTIFCQTPPPPYLFCRSSMIVQLICQFSEDGCGTQFVLLLTSIAILSEVSDVHVHNHFLVSILHVEPIIPQLVWAAAKYTFLCSNLLIALLLLDKVVCGNVSLACTSGCWPCR